MAISNKLKVAFIVIIIFFITGIVIFFGGLQQLYKVISRKPSTRSHLIDIEPLGIVNNSKIILFYTSWFGYIPWPGIKDREDGLHSEKGVLCSEKRCRISYRASDFLRSDAVVFHGCQLSRKWIKNEVTTSLIHRKPKNQKWVWYEHENPHNIGYDARVLNGMIDIAVTYKMDSGIWSPYGSYSNTSSKQTETNYTENKNKLALWVVSNCKSVLRIQIVRKLREFIPIDVYGGCSSYFYWRTRSCKPDCTEIIKKYKFYFALENRHCKDYITEKYWHNAIENNVVPIVAAGEFGRRVLIPGSYIDLLDFPSPKALADYLTYLDRNSTAYNEYFSWKKSYKYNLQHHMWICELCGLLHSGGEQQKTAIENFGEFYGIEANCPSNYASIYYNWLHNSGSRHWYNLFQLIITLLLLGLSV